MKNIPLFTTPYGVATLILSELPHNQTAYVHVRTVSDLEGLLAECTTFCRMCGAEALYGTGEGDWEGYELAYEEWEYQVTKEDLPQAWNPVELVPVTTENKKTYEVLYNKTFASHVGTPQHLYDTIPENGYLAYQNGIFIGLGQITETTLQTIVSSEKGRGYDLALSLLVKIQSPTIALAVMSYNQRAIALYGRLGFVKTRVLHKNFKIW